MTLYYSSMGGQNHEASCDQEGCEERLVLDGRLTLTELICKVQDEGWLFEDGKLLCHEHGWHGRPMKEGVVM